MGGPPDGLGIRAAGVGSRAYVGFRASLKWEARLGAKGDDPVIIDDYMSLGGNFDFSKGGTLNFLGFCI